MADQQRTHTKGKLVVVPDLMHVGRTSHGCCARSHRQSSLGMMSWRPSTRAIASACFIAYLHASAQHGV